MTSKTIRIAYAAFLLCAGITALYLYSFGWKVDAASMDANIETLTRPHLLVDSDDSEWSLVAEQAIREGSWRVRTIADDNVPFGRPHHWPSPFLWLILIGAWFSANVFGVADVQSAVYYGATAVNPLLFFGFVLAFAYPAIKRFGIIGAVFLCFGFAWTYRGSVDFLGIRPDHHALINTILTVFLVSTILLAEERKKWGGIFWLSVLSGALAIWVGPLGVLPMIAAWGGAFLLTTFFGPDDKRKYSSLWMPWGTAIAGFIVLGNIVEYFPTLPPLQMEVSNLTYALGFLGAGALFAAIEKARDEGFSFSSEHQRRLWLVGVVGCSIPVLTVAIGRGGVLSNLQQICGRLMSSIIECQPTRMANYLDYVPFFIPAIIAASLAWHFRKQNSFGFAMTAPLMLFGCLLSFQYQRMLPYAIIVVAITLAFTSRSWWRSDIKSSWVGICSSLGLIGLIFSLNTSFSGYQSEIRIGGRGLFGSRLEQRTFSTALQADAKKQGDASFVIIASPDVSTVLAYHTGAATVARIYWENKTGIERYIFAMASSDMQDLEDLVKESNADYVMFPGKGVQRDNLMFTIHGPSAYVKDYASNMATLDDPDKRPPWLEVAPGISSSGVVFLSKLKFYIFKVNKAALEKTTTAQ